MADTPGYPATLRLAGRRVLVVGGGTVATRRIPALLDAGAVVDVIAPDASTEIREAAGAGRLRWRQRRFQPRDVLEPEPAWLVHATTDSPAVNAVVATACDEHRVWCVRADDADASSVWTPADTADWTTCSRDDARVKLPSSATATKVARWRSSMVRRLLSHCAIADSRTMRCL